MKASVRETAVAGAFYPMHPGDLQRQLDRLVPGDLITVDAPTGSHTYAVVASRVVEPDELWVTGQWRGA